MRTAPPEAGRLQRYGIALAAVGVAFVATYLTWPFLKSTPWAFFFAAVMVSAWFGGLGPSIVATTLIAVIGRYFFIEPYGSFTLGRNALIPTLVFIGVSLFISFLASVRRRAEAFERGERRRFQATVTSMGDAIIATDASGRVTFMNGVAEELIGWKLLEADGRRLEEVFVIINEKTRQATPNPVKKVLETGRIQGLANHTILIAKDGSERPIDDSAAPIKDDQGEITGVVLVFRDITEKYEAARRLRESEEHLKSVFDAAAEGLYVMSPDSRCTYINAAGAAMLGYRTEELLDCSLHEVIHHHRPDGSEYPIAECHIARAARQGVNVRVDDEMFWRKDGTAIPVVYSASQMLVGGENAGAVVTFSDVTERKRAEAQIRLAAEANAKFRTMFEQGAQFAGILALDGTVVEANRLCLDACGFTRVEVIGRPFWECGWWNQSPALMEMIREASLQAAAGRLYRAETDYFVADGSKRFVDLVLAPVTDEDGRVIFITATGTDITDRKRAEEELRAAEQQTRTVLESITEGFVAVDSDWRFTYLNARAEHIYNIRRGDLIGKDFWEVFPEALGTLFEREYRRAMADRTLTQVEAPFERLNGWFEVNAYPVKDGGLSFYFRDVTDRRRAEEAREQRAWQLQKLADIATRINSAHDVASLLGVVTEEARNLVGVHQAATNLVLDPHHPQPITAVSASRKHARQSSSPDIDALRLYEAFNQKNEPIRLSKKDLEANPKGPLSGTLASDGPTLNGWLAVPLMGRNGKTIGHIQLADKDEGEFTPEDEAILVQLSRLAAIAIENAKLYDELRGNDQRKDEFLAMLAHELRNPLAAIGSAVNLTTRSSLKEHRDWSMDVITRQIKHLTRLIDDLLDVSRISRGKIELRKHVLESTPILDSSVVTVRPLVEERKHTLDVSIDRENLWVNVDPTRLEQVVVNLLNNAAKYSGNGGHIWLSAHNEGGEVVISVKDQGVGIPPEKLPQMFELFAQGDRSLARSEGGLGIGLTVVKKLVEMHGGSISAKSEGIGKGSEFTIRLPGATRSSVPRAKGLESAETASKKSRILVVDDNVDTAYGMARLLELIGHEVAIAHDGHEALEVARVFGPEFILLDIGLPGMDGYKVASKLRQEECCKAAVIVAVSGYGQDEDRRRSKEAGFDFHLIKPLDHDALLSLLSTASSGRD